jgi:endonuclease-3
MGTVVSYDWEEIIKTLKETVLKLNPPVLLMINTHKNDPFKTFVCTVLASRSRDEVTVKVCERLFKKFRSFKDLAQAPLEEIEKTLKGLGLYRQKASYLKESSKIIMEKFQGKLPDTLEDLIQLKGVGRKVANLILQRVYGKETISVDTHVHRIANRLGLVKTKTPSQTEKALKELIDRKYWKDINLLFVALGQTICKPQKPLCEQCPIRKWCSYGKKNSSN